MEADLAHFAAAVHAADLDGQTASDATATMAVATFTAASSKLVHATYRIILLTRTLGAFDFFCFSIISIESPTTQRNARQKNLPFSILRFT